MKTVFIRHNLNVTDETLNKLKSKRLIAINFGNKSSIWPADYKTAGRKALGFLWKCCKSGAVVGADYGKSMLVGKITRNSKVKAMKINDRHRGNLIFKTVKLTKAKEISYLTYPLLKAIQPRQITITGWPSAYNHLDAILHNKKIPLDVNSLHPNQLEVICYEYLKIKKVIEVLLMPIGRSLPDIDILGIGNGKTVVSQVTHSDNPNEISAKIQRLRQYKSKNSVLIFFGPESQSQGYRDVRYISTREVFYLFKSDHNSIYYKMLKKMLGR